MMFRVSGYILKENKEIFIALTAIYGIGIPTALKICKAMNLSHTLRIKDMDQSLALKLTEYINQNHTTGDDLKKEVSANKKKYIALNCYRGKRLRLGLPAHGQKTRSNARTARMLCKK